MKPRKNGWNTIKPKWIKSQEIVRKQCTIDETIRKQWRIIQNPVVVHTSIQIFSFFVYCSYKCFVIDLFFLWFSTVVYMKRIFVSKIELQEFPKCHRGDKCKKINRIIFEEFTEPGVPLTIPNPVGPWFGRQTINGLRITSGETLLDLCGSGDGAEKAISVGRLLQRERFFFFFYPKKIHIYSACSKFYNLYRSVQNVKKEMAFEMQNSW